MRAVLLLLLSIVTVGCLTSRLTGDREPAALAIVSERCGACHGVTLGERCLAGPCANRAHAIEPRPWDLVLEWMEAVGCVLPAGEKAQLASYLLDRYPKTYPVRWERLEPVPEGWNVVALASYRGGLYAGLEGAGKIYRLDGREWRTVLTTGAYTVYGLVSFGNRLVAGTNQTAAGIWSSEDGATWRRDAVLPAEERGVISLGQFRGELYAGTTRGRVYRSGDGVTWESAGELLPGADNSFANWVRFLAAHRGVFYAGIESGGLFRSLDGRRWDAVTFREGVSVGVRASSVFGEHFYLGTTSGGEIWRTADGEHWGRVFGGAALPGRGYVASLGAAGGRLYAGINGRVYRSAEGTAWEEVGQLTPYTIESLQEFTGSLYAGTTLPSRAWVYRMRP